MSDPFVQKLFEELISQVTMGFVDQDIRPMTYEDQVEFFSNTNVRNEMLDICRKVKCRIQDNYDVDKRVGYNGTFEDYLQGLEHGDFRELIYGDGNEDKSHVSLYFLYKSYEEKMRNLTKPEDKLDEMLDNRNMTFDEFGALGALGFQ